MAQENNQDHRTRLAELKRRVGKQILCIRIYQERNSFYFEREVIEGDGMSFTMCMPFNSVTAAFQLIESDPYYAHVFEELKRALTKIDSLSRQSK